MKFLDRVLFEPEVSFKVTKVGKEEEKYVVCGEFVEGARKPVLEDIVKEYEQKCKAAKGKTDAACKGPKYAEESPTPLSEILKLSDDYKAISFEESLRKANFTSDELIRKSKGKMEELKKVAKDFGLSKTDIMAIFTYTFENKEEKEKKKGNSPYNIVNSALAERDREKLLPIREYIFYLLMGLRQLPVFKREDVLYRGVNMPSGVAKSIYREGSTLTWTSFSSTTTDESRAYGFAKDSGVIFEIHGKFRGYSIGTLSRYTKEEGKILFTFNDSIFC